MLTSNKKKILILVDWFEPGYKAGGPIQSCKNFVKAFQNDYDLYIITSDRDLGDTTSYKGIQTGQWLNFNEHVKIYYASNNGLNFSTIEKLILGIQPDYLYLNNMYSLKFTIIPLLLKLIKKIRANIILSPRGMLQDGAIQFKKYKKKLFLTILQFLNIPQQITFHATDEQEKKDIQKYFPKASRVFVADNFGPMIDLTWVSVPKISGELKLIFLSRISPKKNLLYALKLFADFSLNAKVFLDIAGGIEDKIYWEECKTVIKSLPSNFQVTYIGLMKNNEVYKKYTDQHVFILPTLGENFGHAIFEALLAGKPVLISDKTPWRNLQAKKIGYDISLDKPIVFKEAIRNLAEWDQAEYDLWSKSAWSYAKQYHIQNDTKAKYQEIFK